MAARLGHPLMPWQRHVADVSLEYDPDTGRLAYSEVDLTIMRQSGKTMGLLLPVMLHRSTFMARRLGRQLTTFTMQDRQMAVKKMKVDFYPTLQESPHFREVLNTKARPNRGATEWQASWTNGAEEIRIGGSNRIFADTPSKKAGHGLTLDLGVVDEARFHVDDRVEQAMSPAQSTRRDPQIWVASTAGDEDSFYLWSKVYAGRADVEAGRESKVAFFEWSIPYEADLEDPEVWWEYHPALGHTIELEFVMAELDKALRNPNDEAIDTFRNEYANQWVRTPPIGVTHQAVIPADLWSDRRAPSQELVGPYALGVDVSPDGKSASIALAGRSTDGRLQIKVLHLEAGTFWLEQRLAKERDTYAPKAIGYNSGGPARALTPEIGRAAGAVTVLGLTGAEYMASCAAFVLGVTENRVCHSDQAWLDAALDGSAKKVRGSGWLWDRSSALADITPIVAATVALRALETVPEEPPPAPVFAA